MATAFKWLSRLLGVLVAGAAGLALLVWILVGGSLPDHDREFRVEGVSSRTTILRDANAVPHIRGETDADVFFALGFAHATDRLWQMEMNRRAATGRLSELLGEATFSFDRFVRALGLGALARRAVADQTPEARAALEAYAAGVNARIRAVSEEALGRGAPEFYLFADSLAPWTPADSLAVAKLMALRLSDQASVETRRAALSLILPRERLVDVLPDHPEPALIEPRTASLPAPPGPATDYAALIEGAPLPAAPVPQAAAQAFPPPGRAGASNAWALDASRAAAGAPILANDPHLWLSAPTLWYLARLEMPGMGGVIGGTVPGMPLVLIGRNADLAWGLTYSYVDDADLYVEKLDPEDPTRYRTPGGWAELETRTERILVAGEGARTVELSRTRHGPVVPPDQLGVGDVTPEGHVMALAWTALGEPDTSFSAGFELMRARSLEEGAAAMEALVAPAFNVTLADRSGVGMVVAGAAPLRDPDSPSRGRLPAPGWRAENDWRGLIPPDELPRLLRPASGAVANANNRTSDAPFPRHLSFHWGEPYRIRRIEKELTAREFHTRDSAAALQNDAVSEMARAVLPLIARDLWWTGPAAPADPVAARRADALEMLGDWNGEMSAHAPEPLIFAEWMRRLTERLAGDELGPAVSEIAGPRPVFVERVFRDVDGAGVWCDIDKTSRTETCAEIAALALDDALAGLAERYGASPRGWRWGEAHEARHDHEVLGRLGPIAPLVNIRHEASGGDHTVLRAQTSGRAPDPHAAVNAAGLRMVVDFADPDASSIVVATGQSGHPLSRHYDDFNQLWRRGDSVRLSLDFADASAGALGIVALVPSPER